MNTKQNQAIADKYAGCNCTLDGKPARVVGRQVVTVRQWLLFVSDFTKGKADHAKNQERVN